MGKNLKSLRVITCVGLAVSTLGLAGCASSERSGTTARSDRELATDVADNLGRAPGYTYPDVAVKADRGRVQLRGYVANEAQKAEAGRIAGQVPGVTHVQNDLEVRPGAVGGAVGGATLPEGTTRP